MAKASPQGEKTSAQADVGYGKPPTEHQFKPGVSGNPKGRPKGTLNVLDVIAKHANKKVKVLENGEEKSMSKLEVVISAAFNKAGKGDVAAMRILVQLLQAHGEMSESKGDVAFSQADIDAVFGAADWQAELAALRADKHHGDK